MKSDRERYTELESALLDSYGANRAALYWVVEWWDSLPPNLQQDIEGSGNEPGAIALARKALVASLSPSVSRPPLGGEA